jgi:hypothetical protein
MFSGKHKAILLTVTVAVALFAATPAIRYYFVFPQKEFFTEFWLLDSNHATENLPFNITNGLSSSVFLGVANHLGTYGYYMIEVKLRNYTESGPDTPAGTPSNLPSLYNIRVFVPDQESREIPLTFSLNYAIDTSNFQKIATVDSVVVNSVKVNYNPPLLSYINGTLTGEGVYQGEFACNLFFELWIYNSALNDFQYHGRSLGLHLSLTPP